VAEGLQYYIERLPLTELCVVPAFPGDTYDTGDEQMTRIAEEVLPLLSATPAPILERV
jgi:hypothetical protein